MSGPLLWMSDPKIQSKSIGDLVLPGTHDSGSYSLTTALSQVIYSNIAFLWQLQSGTATKPYVPTFGNGSPIYVGQDLSSFVFQLVLDISRAQCNSVGQQLADGIRFFDLRVYWDSSLGGVYIQHGLRGSSLEDVLGEVAAFLGATPDGRELILLQLSHANFNQFAAAPAAVDSLLNQYLGGSLYTPSGIDQALADTALSSVTQSGSRVIAMTTDSDYSYPPDSPVLATTGFQTSGRSADGTNSVTELAQLEAAGLQGRTGPFYAIWWTLTPQASDVVAEATNRLAGGAPTPALQVLATEANAQLENFINDNSGSSFNLIASDCYGNSPVVALAIALSGG